MVGQTISHYVILEKLGAGGMGVVYKAEDTRLKRLVALKFLPPDFTTDSDAKERFILEAQAASSLQHANICSIHDIEETIDGRLFIVMDCYEGETLKQKIESGPLDLEEAAEIIRQAASGLAKAHEKGIVHRDIKPANIMITTDGVVKILDFGVAKLSGRTMLTKTHSTIGTAAYMSPEQAKGESVDARSDLWAIGVVMYEMLAGQHPFRGEHEAALIYEILNIDPPPLHQRRPGLPGHVTELVGSLLQRDPARRPPSASEVIRILDHPRQEVPRSEAEKSIAVLYFENMSSERDTDYFCAGITEDVITDLSKVRSLKIVPRNDVLPFRNKDVNIRQLGETLHVNYVLEGSVRKAGERIRITAKLSDVRSGFHVWADRFDRLLEDIFDLQNEVSAKIVDALRISLTETERGSLHRKRTDDLRAYDFYMRGKELVIHRGRKDAELAVQMFERAVAIDPHFVGALSGLAEAFSHLFTWYDGDPAWLTKILEVSEKALRLEPDSPEARLALGSVFFHQKRFPEALRMFEGLVQDDDDSYEAYLWMGMVHDLTERPDEAIRCYERAIEIKPYSEEPLVRLDMTYRRAGDLPRSDDAARRALETGLRRLELDPGGLVTRSRVAAQFARCGRRDDAIEQARMIRRLDPTDGHAHYNAACAMAMLGEKDEMLACLRVALQGGAVFRGWVRKDPDFKIFQNDDDFLRLIDGTD